MQQVQGQQQQQQQPLELLPLPQPTAESPLTDLERAAAELQRAGQATAPFPRARPLLPVASSSWDDHDHLDPLELEELDALVAAQREAQLAPPPLQPRRMLRADEAWEAFEAQLEADLITTLTTLVAILGVICFWRGVWSLLDYLLGDSPIGDFCCILVGFSIILYIRLAGLKVGTFWPR